MTKGNGLALKSPVFAFVAKSRHIAMVSLILSLIALLYTLRGTSISLYGLWMNSNEYGHGVLVAPLVLYLLWMRRNDLARTAIQPSVLGLLITVALIAIWSLSNILGVLIGEQLALVLLLLSIPYAVAGRGLLRICALPVLLLLLAVPIWTFINPILQANTATASTAMSRFFGVPTFNEGVYLTIPGGRFLVADVCSGLRYLLASLTLASLFAIINLHSIRYRLLLIFFAFALSTVFNWIRVTIIVSAGHYFGMETFLVVKELYLGWFLFVVVAVLLVWFGNMLQNREMRGSTTRGAEGKHSVEPERQGALSGLYALLSILALWLAGGLIAVDPQAGLGTTTLELRQLPITGYQSEVSSRAPRWQPLFTNADATAQTVFTENRQPLSLYVAYYGQQRQGAEVVNETNDLFDRKVWRRTAVRARPEIIAVNPHLQAEEFQITQIDGRQLRLLWRIYWVAGEFVGNGIDAKFSQIKSLLRGDRSAAGIVLSIPITVSLEQSREQLRKFLAAGLAPLGEYLSSLD